MKQNTLKEEMGNSTIIIRDFNILLSRMTTITRQKIKNVDGLDNISQLALSRNSRIHILKCTRNISRIRW